MSTPVESSVQAVRGRNRARLGIVPHIARLPLVRVVARRLATAVPLLFVVSVVSFALISLAPGDAAEEILGPTATRAELTHLRHALGLNEPLYTQYWHWLRHALTGDLGTSIFTGQRVGQEIAQRLPCTLSLVIGALLVSILVGGALGVYSAIRGGYRGRLVDALALAGFALPSFWVGAQLIVVFAVKLRWLPASGYVSISASPSEWLRSLVLPVAALSLFGVAAIAKQTREAMLEALASEYVRMARASGVPARSIFFRHALRNASIRVLTVLGVQAIALLGGTVLVETVFALPGLGSLIVTAALQHDLPVVEGVTVLFTLIVVAVNLLIDLAYTALDPKLRLP